MKIPNDISPPELARHTVETFIREGIRIAPPTNPRGELARRAATFVTIRTVNGELRGCIGTIQPAFPTVAEEIVQNAISAATRDPRFPPVSAPELQSLAYGVDVLSATEAIQSLQELDPGVYGLIIETLDGRRRGLLLPRIEGIETVEQQWQGAHSKAGIEPGTPVKMERFTVRRYEKE